ncbi:MAG: hypothetical protein JWQ49_1219 [Edaphobacter sp.]|nr:hypothetical protein [Edaphobacter sp.]
MVSKERWELLNEITTREMQRSKDAWVAGGKDITKFRAIPSTHPTQSVAARAYREGTPIPKKAPFPQPLIDHVRAEAEYRFKAGTQENRFSPEDLTDISSLVGQKLLLSSWRCGKELVW